MDKLKIYEKLGAKKFQKFVFEIEKLKYKLLKPFSKKIIKYVDKKIDKKLDKFLKNRKKENKFISILNKINIINYKKDGIKKQRLEFLKKLSDEEIISYFNREKLKVRIEFNNRENRNYHLNKLNVRETIMYLNINKMIHQTGILSNIFWISITSISLSLFDGILISICNFILSYQVISIFINFECINLQNYNILRLEKRMEKLEQIRKKKQEKRVKKYSEVSKSLGPLLSKSKTLPNKIEIINNLNTSLQLEEMRALIEETIKEKERKLKL